RRPDLARRARAARRLWRRHRRRLDPAARGAHELRRRRRGVHRLARRGALRARVPHAQPLDLRHRRPGRARLRDRALPPDLLRLARGGKRLDGELDVPVGGRRRGVHVAARPAGLRRARRADRAAGPLRRRAARRGGGRERPLEGRLLQGVRGRPRAAGRRGEPRPPRARHLRRQGAAGARAELALVRDGGAREGRPRPARVRARGGDARMTGLRRYHAAVWDEPLVLELGREGRRGIVFPEAEPEVRERVGDAASLLPAGARRAAPPALPELSEPEVLRHYLHLSQETLGMMGISLFGTCTMKYNPRLGEELAARPELAELHPCQDEETLQGVLGLVHGLDEILRALSGMDRFVFQAGGGAHASYTFACIARAYHAARGELGRRDEVITTIQAHPCNAATAAAAGFKVVTLMLGDEGYAPLDALEAAVSDRTAALMVNNPD